MTQVRTVRLLAALGGALALALVLTGCPEDATDIVEIKASVIDFPVAPAGVGLPTGTLAINRFRTLPAGAGRRPDSISITFQNVETLASGEYRLWLSNRDKSPVPIIAAVGTYQKIQIIRQLDPLTGEVISERDSIVETVPATSAFAGEAGLIKHRIILGDAGRGTTDSIGFFTDAFVTIEPAPGASTSSAARILWFQYTDQKGTPDDFRDDVSRTGTLLFGTFNPETPARSRTFGIKDLAQSSGFGGVRDNEVSVDLRNLPRPPVGMFFEGWLVGPDGNAVRMGPITTLAPDTTSLFDADVDPPPAGVTATGIRFANARVLLSSPEEILAREGDQFVAKLEQFLLTVEPKAGVPTRAPATGMVGPLPIARMIDRLRE